MMSVQVPFTVTIVSFLHNFVSVLCICMAVPMNNSNLDIPLDTHSNKHMHIVSFMSTSIVLQYAVYGTKIYGIRNGIKTKAMEMVR